MQRVHTYLNPIARLGKEQYSFYFSLCFSLFLILISEIYAYQIAHDPMIVGVYIIFLHVGAILYFSFRDGIYGGFTAVITAIAYYFYIIYTRGYRGQQLESGIETTIILGILYFLLAWIIGWLKQKIDTLIRREADEKKRLQSIIHQLPVGVIITDSTGRIVETNDQLESIIGMKMPLGIIAGKDNVLPAYSKGKKVESSDSPLAQTLATGKKILDREFILETPNKKKRYIVVNASTIQNNEGKVIAAASIIKDITLQRELEDRKDDFINMASHELKTPVTSMKLYFDMLMRYTQKTTNSKVNHVIESLSDQTERLQNLVNNLLDVSRVHTGKFTLEKQSFRLDELVENVTEEIQKETRRVSIKIRKIKQVVVFADKLRIYQVLTNLLTNAIKYSPEKSEVEISITLKKSHVYISIQDHGIGIEKEQQKKIFDRLYQVTDAKEQTFPGLGMGLYISKEIIKKHKGKIWVESKKGEGSTFSFYLPIDVKIKK
jgi:two-component system phosphate regulon sensor histidine kinase PhoR